MPNNDGHALTARVLEKGAIVVIKKGVLQIVTESGSPAPVDWVSENETQIVAEIAEAMGVHALRYTNYDVGRYQGYSGLTLRFSDISDGSEYYAIFNVILDRARNTKHGSKGKALKRGEFRVGKNHGFTKFWLKAGLELPRRLSTFHDRMGKLKAPVLTGELSNNPSNPDRLEAKTLTALNLSPEAIKAAFLPDNFRTSSGQLPDNSRTNLPDNEIHKTLDTKGLNRDSNYVENNHDIKITSNQGNKVSSNTSIGNNTREQSTDEWLADYEARYQEL